MEMLLTKQVWELKMFLQRGYYLWCNRKSWNDQWIASDITSTRDITSGSLPTTKSERLIRLIPRLTVEKYSLKNILSVCMLIVLKLCLSIGRVLRSKSSMIRARSGNLLMISCSANEGLSPGMSNKSHRYCLHTEQGSMNFCLSLVASDRTPLKIFSLYWARVRTFSLQYFCELRRVNSKNVKATRRCRFELRHLLQAPGISPIAAHVVVAKCEIESKTVFWSVWNLSAGAAHKKATRNGSKLIRKKDFLHFVEKPLGGRKRTAETGLAWGKRSSLADTICCANKSLESGRRIIDCEDYHHGIKYVAAPVPLWHCHTQTGLAGRRWSSSCVCLASFLLSANDLRCELSVYSNVDMLTLTIAFLRKSPQNFILSLLFGRNFNENLCDRRDLRTADGVGPVTWRAVPRGSQLNVKRQRVRCSCFTC